MGIAVSKKKKKTYAEIDAELKIIKSVRRSEAYVVLGQSAIKYGGFLGMSYFAYLSRRLLGRLRLPTLL